MRASLSDSIYADVDVIRGCLSAFLVLTTVDLPAQTVARVVFIQEISREDVEQDIEDLKQASNRLLEQLRQNLDDPRLADVASESPMDGNENQRVMEIQKNLKLLQRVIKDKQAKAMEQKALSSKQNTMPMATMNMDSEVDAPMPEQTNPATVDSRSLRMPKKVLDKIVNAFELGNSLFLAGNIDQAIKYYEIVPADKLTAYERNWLEFMIASCHQRNGDYDLAEAGFRTIAAFKDSPRLSQSAKESLKYCVSRNRVSGIVAEYSSKADEVLKKANVLIGDSADGK